MSNEMKDFSSLNGFKVKDAAARQILADLQKNVDNNSNELSTIKENKFFAHSILEYGAKNDGSEDIAEAITAAYDDGVTQLFFPSGLYLCETDFRNIPMSYVVGDNVEFDGVYYHLFNLDGSIKFADSVNGEKWSSWAMKRITSDYEGGFGRVGSALHVRTEAHNEGSFEWNLLSVLDNYSNSGQNCGAYIQGNKFGDGATWGACIEAIQKERVLNPESGLVGLEVDVSADETDENFNRVGIDVFLRGYLGNSSSQNQYGYGLRINSEGGLTHHGIQLKGDFSKGIDFTLATIHNYALSLKTQQKINWDSSLDLYGAYNTLCVDVSGKRVSEINKDGISIFGKVQVNGIAYTGNLKGSRVSTLAENAIEVVVSGATYFIPIYTE